jgi:hypothetical protein
MPNAAHVTLIERFYTAFAALEGLEMKACYAPDARFDDPAFSLRGRDEIGAMWDMLARAVEARGRDVWRLRFDRVRADDANGSAHWEAHYRFSATGRRVHNVIDASFTFRDGLIATHCDRFGFWRWSRQALGATGYLLGWTPFLQQQVRTRAAASLATFRANAVR